MYPSPQEALPLPARPSLDYYRTLAKDLIKACRSGNPASVAAWATRWAERLAAGDGQSGRSARTTADIDARARQIPRYLEARVARVAAAA